MENTTLATKPRPTAALRWTALIFLSIAMFGSYFVYDVLPVVNDLLEKQLGFSQSQIGFLRTLYSLPNIVMVVIGGFVIDRIGVRKSLLIFGSLCAFGALLQLSPDYNVMASGWFFFGIGAESLIVAVTTSLAKWFKGKELSFAFGLNLTIARLGSFAAENSPTWANPLFHFWRDPIYLSALSGLIALGAVVVYYFLEMKTEKKYLLGEAEEPDKVVFKDIFNFKPAFWFVVALCVTFYSAIFPFQTFAVRLFQDVHGLSREAGGFLNSMPILMAMVFTPLFGLLADKIGKRATLMAIGSILIMPIYLLLVYAPISPYFSMVILGIAFSLVPAVMWPSVALIVPQSKLGTAYGVMTMIQNIGLAGFNYVIGYANDATGGYTTGMWIFSILGFLGLFFALMLKKYGPELETEKAK